MSRSLGPPLLTPLLGAALSNPSDSAHGMSYPAREEKLRCYFSEQDDSNGTISSSGKSKHSRNTQKSCHLSQVLPKVRFWQSWVPIPCLDHITPVQVVWKYFGHKGIDAIFLDWNLAINFLRPFLSRQLGFTGLFSESTFTNLKNKPASNWHTVYFHSLASLYNFAQTMNCFAVFPKRQNPTIALLKVAMLYPKPRFPGLENRMPVFISSLPSFSNHHQFFFRKAFPFFSSVDMLGNFQSEKYVSLHWVWEQVQKLCWLPGSAHKSHHPFVPETHNCKMRSRICEML